MFEPFNWILLMCAAAGLLMVAGSIALLYNGVIRLSEKNTGHALEAEFKDQLKINVRNPALGLFAIGLAFFGLALHFAKPEGAKPESELVIKGHIKDFANLEGVVATLRSVDQTVDITSDGDIFTTIQPLEHIRIVIEAPPAHPYTHNFNLDEIKHGRVEIKFRLDTATAGTKPKPNIQSQPIPITKSRTAAR